jgi:hypothetical protein
VRTAGALLTVAALIAVATPSCGGSGPADPPCLSAGFDAGGDPYCEALLQTVLSCVPSDGCWTDAVQQCALAAPSANRPWDTAAAGALSCDVLTHGWAPGDDGGAVTTTPALDKLAHDYCAVCDDSNCPDRLFGPTSMLSILASASDALVADVEKECIVPLGSMPTPDACQNFGTCAFAPTQLDAFYNGPRNGCSNTTAHAGCDAPQQQPAAWAVRFGDDHLQNAEAMSVDPTGNILITGQMAGTLDFGMGAIMASAPLDRFLARVSASGQPEWSKSIGSQVGPFEVSFVAAAGDGSIVVAGSNASTSPTPWSDIASFDATGALRWHKNWMDPSWVGGGGHPLVIQGLGADGAGGSVIGGWYGGTFDFGTGPQASSGMTDGVLVSFDPAGATRWVRHFGNPGTDTFIDDIAVDPTGNTFVTGSFEGTIDLGSGPLVDPDQSPGAGLYIFVAAFDPTGKGLWARSLGGADRQKAGTIVATADRGVIVGGWVEGSLDLDGHSITSSSNPEMYVARLDPTGRVTWARPVGMTSAVDSPLLALDSQGHILLTGTCENDLDIIGSIPCGAPDDTFAAKLDADGNAMWTTLHRHARWSGVGAAPSGHVILGGSVAGAVDIGGISLQTPAGSWDVALAALMP